TSPAPASLLPINVRFAVSMTVNNVTATLGRPFLPSAQDQVQTLGTKTVQLRRPDPLNTPDLYELSVTHNAVAGPDTTETWKLEITGLPQGLRAIGFLRPDTFKAARPAGSCAGSTGTVVRQSMTFSGASTPTMEFKVASGIPAQTLTTLFTEFGSE